MKNYSVTLPIVGVAHMELEAESESAALELALDRIERDDITEWEAVKHITRGSILYAPQNSYDIEEIE